MVSVFERSTSGVVWRTVGLLPAQRAWDGVWWHCRLWQWNSGRRRRLWLWQRSVVGQNAVVLIIVIIIIIIIIIIVIGPIQWGQRSPLSRVVVVVVVVVVVDIGVRRLAVANRPNIFQMLLVIIFLFKSDVPMMRVPDFHYTANRGYW